MLLLKLWRSLKKIFLYIYLRFLLLRFYSIISISTFFSIIIGRTNKHNAVFDKWHLFTFTYSSNRHVIALRWQKNKYSIEDVDYSHTSVIIWLISISIIPIINMPKWRGKFIFVCLWPSRYPKCRHHILLFRLLLTYKISIHQVS